MGQLPILLLDERLVWPRWAVQQPLRAGSKPLWVELWIGSRRVSALYRRVDRERDGWQHRLSRKREGRGGVQGQRRAGETGRRVSQLSNPVAPGGSGATRSRCGP